MRAAPFKGNIVVTNMPDDFTGSDLASLFDEFGLVLGAVIERRDGEEGRAPRGLVSLAPPSAVETAISSLDDRVISQRHLKVRKAPEPPKKKAGPRPSSGVRAARPARPREPLPSFAPAPAAAAVVRRAPIVERRTIGTPGQRRVRFFDESKNERG